jgi:ATP synthase protein I
MAWKVPFKTTREQREEFRQGADASTIAWFFFAAIAIGIGYVAGYWIDRWFHTEPWGAVNGACLGIATGFVNLFQVAGRISKAEEEESRRKRGEGPKP